MDKKLQAELRKLDRVGFRELELCIGIARQFRQLGPDHKKTDAQVWEQFGFDIKKLEEYKTGSYPYTITDIAAIQAAYATLELEAITEKIKLKVEEAINE